MRQAQGGLLHCFMYNKMLKSEMVRMVWKVIIKKEPTTVVLRTGIGSAS